jgi:hypothetical protein
MMLFFEAEKVADAGLIDDRWPCPRGYQTVHVRPDADGYRLPTEEEFTYAATAGKNTRYSWGNDPKKVAKHAWLFDTSMGATHPVGQKQPNALGLFDMEGNVSEMAGTPGGAHVSRMGGSSLDLTVGINQGKPPFSPMGWGYPDIGFRVVRQVPQPKSRSSFLDGGPFAARGVGRFGRSAGNQSGAPGVYILLHK